MRGTEAKMLSRTSPITHSASCIMTINTVAYALSPPFPSCKQAELCLDSLWPAQCPTPTVSVPQHALGMRKLPSPGETSTGKRE